MIRDTMLNEILALPLDDRRKLIEIIKKSLEEEPKPSLKGRVLGLGANSKFWMSDNFDESVFPEDWMDDPSDPLNWRADKKDTN